MGALPQWHGLCRSFPVPFLRRRYGKKKSRKFSTALFLIRASCFRTPGEACRVLGSSKRKGLTLTNRTVAIVGPASYIEGEGVEKLIDSSDYVIRPNCKLLPNLNGLLLPRNTTRRCDIVYHSGAVENETHDGPTKNIQEVIMTDHWYAHIFLRWSGLRQR